jgi:hypothetical protein
VSWDQRFFDPIILPGRKQLVTLCDGVEYIEEFPDAEHVISHWKMRFANKDRRAGWSPPGRANARPMAGSGVTRHLSTRWVVDLKTNQQSGSCCSQKWRVTASPTTRPTALDLTRCRPQRVMLPGDACRCRDDADMPVICPTCQIVSSAEMADEITSNNHQPDGLDLV